MGNKAMLIMSSLIIISLFVICILLFMKNRKIEKETNIYDKRIDAQIRNLSD